MPCESRYADAVSPRHDRPSSGRSLRPLISIVAFIFIGWLVWLGWDAPRMWKNPRAAEVATSASRVIEAIKSYRSSHEGKVPDTQLALIDFMRNELPVRCFLQILGVTRSCTCRATPSSIART
jgi:hypothetical protein